VGVDKDFYRQISLIEGDQPQESNVGKVSDMYTNNPLPEYSYKESEYSEGSDSHSNNGGYDKNNPLEMLKSPFEMPKNEDDFDSQDKEIFQGYHNDQNKQGSPSDHSDLYAMIGRKVVQDMLKQRNETQQQSKGDSQQSILKKLLGGNLNQQDVGVDRLLVSKVTSTTSPKQVTNLPTVPSQGNVFTSGRIPLKEAFTHDSKETTQTLVLPKGINLSIQGHVFQADPLAASSMIKDQTPTVREPSLNAAADLEKKLQNSEMPSDETTLNKQIPPKEVDLKKENYVTFKISGAGEPVSFKAGTSNDGSLLLKVPGNVKLVDTDTIKEISSKATLNENEKDNTKLKMATDGEKMNRYLWESQTNPTQEFPVKKGDTIGSYDEKPIKEMLSWQILGKTNAKLNQDEIGRSEAKDILQDDDKVMSAVRPTSGRFVFLSPTALHSLSLMSPTKYNELSRVSFAGVGKSPPSELFPSKLNLRENVDNNRALSLKNLLRPSKFIEDSPTSRGRLSEAPARYMPTSNIIHQGTFFQTIDNRIFSDFSLAFLQYKGKYEVFKMKPMLTRFFQLRLLKARGF